MPEGETKKKKKVARVLLYTYGKCYIVAVAKPDGRKEEVIV